MWADEPGAGAKLDIGARTRVAERFHLVVWCNQSAVTDDRGRFRVEKLPPGLAQVSHVIEVPGKEGSSYRPVQFVEIAAGKPTQLVFGGSGRPIMGKLVGAGNFKDVRIRIAPNAPYAGFLADSQDPTWPAYAQFLRSPAGKNYVKGGLKVNADGTFRIENVPPESYQLFVTVPGAGGKAENIGYRSFTIKTIPGGVSDEPHDLGEIKVSFPVGTAERNQATSPATEPKASQTAPATRLLAEAEKKMPSKAGGGAEENKIPWGKPTQGLAVRLRPEKQTISAKKKTAEFQIDVRNDWPKTHRVLKARDDVWLEVDGKWYQRTVDEAGTVTTKTFKRNDKADAFLTLALKTGENKDWRGGHFRRDGKIPSPTGETRAPAKTLNLVPGTHKVHVALRPQPQDGERLGDLEYAYSKTVEVEIVAEDESAKAPNPAELESKQLIGRWVGGGGILPIHHTFAADGSYVQEVPLPDEKPQRGTWRLEGKHLIRKVGGQERKTRISSQTPDAFRVHTKDTGSWMYRRIDERTGSVILWGEVVEGVRMRVTQGKFAIAPAEKIDLRVDVHNDGNVDRRIALEKDRLGTR